MKKEKAILLFPFLLVSYEITAYLATDMYLPALPNMIADLHISNRLGQLTLTSWFLGASCLQLIVGPLSDRYGRRPVLLTGAIVFIISTVFCAITNDIITLLVARFFQGSTVCSVVVAGYASIHESYEQQQAIKILALMGSITVLAPSAGPLLGSIILLFGNWQTIFWLLTIGGTISFILLFKWMPETNPDGHQHPIEIKKIAHNYYTIVTCKDFMLNTMAMCFVFSGMIAWITAGPLLIIQDYHYSAFMFSVFQIMIFGSFIAGTQIVGLLIHRMTPEKIAVIGLSITLLGSMSALLSTLLFPSSVWLFVSMMMLYASGGGMTFSPMQRLAIESSHAPTGAKMAVFTTGTSGFAVMGAFLVTIFYDGQLISLALIVGIVAGIGAMIKLYHAILRQ